MPREKSSVDLEVDINRLFFIVWRGKWVVALSVILFFLGSYYYIKYVAVPTYKSAAVVVMESRQAQVMGVSMENILGSLSNDASVVATEVQVLQSRELMGRTVDKLNLVNDSEFNTYLHPKNFTEKFMAAIFKSNPNRQDPLRIRDSVVSTLLQKINITNISDSLAFTIMVETESPIKSALIADTIASIYIDDQVRMKFEATKKAAEWLAEQASGLKSELQKSEEVIRRFQSDMSITSAEELAALDRQLKDTRDQIAAAEAQIQIIKNRQSKMTLAVGRVEQAAALNDPQLTELAVPADRGDPNAAVSFDARLKLVDQQLSQDLVRLRAQSASYLLAEQNLTKNITLASQELTHFDQMVREADSSKLLYEHFQTRLKEAVAQQGIQQSDSRILSKAVQSFAPASPQRGLIYALAIVIGSLIGGILVLLRETASKGIRTASDLETLTGRVVLGQIPLIPSKQRSDILTYLAKNPTSAGAEAVRSTRTSILLSSTSEAPKVIAVASSVPGEGKTTLSLSLGQNLTAMGKRILIIEGDIRRRSFNNYIKVRKDYGLVSVISGKTTLAESVQTIPEVGDILFGDKSELNAADIFSSSSFGSLIKECRDLYDMIIIDTPPVLVVPDARIIAQHVDAAIFVVRWDRTMQSQVQDSLQMLESTGVQIAGLVLTQIDPKGMRSYGYGERYGAYASYGKRYYTSD